ncbi:MAG: MFS transporter [Dehalococcoidia bacterium]
MTTPENTIPLGLSNSPGGYREALKSRDFLKLFIGQLGSEIGNGAMQLALPFLVLDITGSAFQLGFAYFWQFLPMLLFGILGGVFVDRWDRRLTIVVVDAIRAVAFLSAAVVFYLGHLTVEHIYALIFLESSLANFFNPARAALMPNLVSPENLRPANSLMEVSRHIGFLPAPIAGGAIAAAFGPASLLVIDGVTFALSGIMVFLITWRPPARHNHDETQPSEGFRKATELVITQTKEGLKVIKERKLLQVSVLLGFSLNLIIAPIQVLLPLFIREVKDAADGYLALLVGGLLVGLIIGSLSAPATARRIGLGILTIVSIILLGFVVSVAAWPAGFQVPLAAMTIAGIAIGGLNVAQTTMLQSSTNDEDRGRVSATYYTFSLGVRPFGYLAVGALASAVDIRIMFTVLGIAAIFLGLYLLRVREVREHA